MLNLNNCSLWASLLEFWRELLHLDDEWRHEDVGADVGGLSRLLTAHVHRHLTWAKHLTACTMVTVRNRLPRCHLYATLSVATYHISKLYKLYWLKTILYKWHGICTAAHLHVWCNSFQSDFWFSCTKFPYLWDGPIPWCRPSRLLAAQEQWWTSEL